MDMQVLEKKLEETLESLGLKEALKEKRSLDAYRAISRIPDEVRMKKVHRTDFNPKGDKITIIPVHDIHYGALNCNKEKFRAYLDYILNTEDTYMLGLGDLIENATKTSVGMGVYDQEVHVGDQIDYIAEALEPLAAAGKILGLMTGNHEFRTSVLIGMDPMYQVCRLLTKATGKEVPYLGYQGFFKWVVGDVVYKAHAFHGRTAATTPGGRINAVRRQNNIMLDADIYLMGHVHTIQDDMDMGYVIDDATDTLVPRRRYYVIGGSLLSYFESYAEMYGLAPSPQGLVRIDLYKTEKRIVIHKP